MYWLYCRIYQNIMKMASYFLPFRKPELIEGPGSIKKVSQVIQKLGLKKILIVTGPNISALGLMNPMLEGLKEAKIEFFVYDKTVQDPTTFNIEDARLLYIENSCEGIIAFGGGSPMDCAKGVACLVARPDKTIASMKGLLKVMKKTPPLIAIPTTSGTGSETTVAAVISDPVTHEKYAINDPVLIPDFAVLDPMLTKGLSPKITSTTGMDALTHAIEAYIGNSNTRETKEMAILAVKLIFDNLYKAYVDGTDLVARERMQKASYYAGVAFTRAYVGYVHGIAHTLGGMYGVAHGLANAVILPYVLEAYGKSAYKKLAQLADEAGITKENQTTKEKAELLIEAIKELNKKMDIPNKIPVILDKDIPLMVKRALKESNPLYPVPRIMNGKELENIYKLIQK